ncbi:tripartite tricarboxylate transporter substrate binding protein [Pigmentiphaga soli]|uniref:Tripartite tricarboxylate transporter substrate binding protein n=1 Tax=Pigmentiphaga soli TaxID=1007095 RepID=A0ABP8GTI1_9BURK
MQHWKTWLAACAAAMQWAAAPAAAAAADYPTKPVRMIVPFVAGGAADMLARPLAQELGEKLGQPVVVENRAGANSTIGVQYVARSPNDGYTILFGSDAGLSLAPNTQPDLGYSVKDFVPLAILAYMTQVMVVNGSSPINSVQDLAREVRARPGQLPYASIGVGSLSHVSMEALAGRFGAPMIHVPYQGVAPALADLLGGRVQIMLSAVAAPLPHIKAGRLKAIAFAGTERSASLPEVPTLAEQGIPDFVSRGWFGVMVPAGTPAPIVAKLQAAIADIAGRKSFQDGVVRANGYDVPRLAPAELAGFLATENAKSKALVDPIRDQLK